ncbi:uncharacterized protein LOC131256114 [Magnolia sinica]|uniref:uncharacterized protein LOC131256114 n=1 Tax=Magnolia sinica TaxID=86752 RepID=UPI002657B462|nr:uncharacterized protein LOC131256114 [Magnolia sinica]
MARVACIQHFRFLRAVAWKGYHSESSICGSKEVAHRERGGSERFDCHVDSPGRQTWVPHQRTGFYYPKGHEKIMDDVLIEAANKCMEIHPFSCSKDARALSSD